VIPRSGLQQIRTASMLFTGQVIKVQTEAGRRGAFSVAQAINALCIQLTCSPRSAKFYVNIIIITLDKEEKRGWL